MNSILNQLKPLTTVEDFNQTMKNYLIKYTICTHNDNYGLVINVLSNEMKSLINNIKNITNDQIIINDNYIYIVNNLELSSEFEKLNNDKSYPEPVKTAFINCINNFLKLQNI